MSNLNKKFFNCTDCNKIFTTKFAANRHYIRSHTDKASVYACSIEDCPFTCYRPSDLLDHEKRHDNPAFKTRKMSHPTSSQQETKMTTEIQGTGSNNFTQNELVQALTNQLAAIPNIPDTPATSTDNMFNTINPSFFDTQTSLSLPDACVITPQYYNPVCSNITTPDIELEENKIENKKDDLEITKEDLERKDNSGTIYSPGLSMIADKAGILTVSKNC